MRLPSKGRSQPVPHQPIHAAELRDLLAAIVESSEDAIISKSPEGVIRSWNRGAERMFGYTAEEAIGQDISILAAPGGIDEGPEMMARMARGERIEHCVTKQRTKDGRIITISLTVSPIREESGRFIGASDVARDITEEDRNRKELEDANKAMAQSNLDLQQFAYSASHDLRQPLRMISTFSEMLKRKFGGQLGAAGDEYIRHITNGAERMQKLIDDLLAFTIASTLEHSEPEEVDAGAALDGAIDKLQYVIKESTASITRTPLPRVRVHRFQLEQLFQNLIGNAIRYRGEEAPRIQVTAEKSGDWWQFCVQDNGIGIEPQYQEQIFGMFKRLHTAAEHSGTGMGLAICQRIVQRLGGRIWVESQLGRGSNFCFTVPG